MKNKTILALLMAVVLIATCFVMAPVTVTAAKTVPIIPEGNTNFLANVSSFSADLYTVDANTYVKLDKEKSTFSWSYFNGPFLAQGVAVGSKHPTLLSADAQVTDNAKGRFDLIFKAQNVRDYFAVYIYANRVDLYRFQYGAGDLILATAPTPVIRKNGKSHVDILCESGTESGFVTIWVDGILCFDHFEIDDVEHSLALGCNACDLALNKDTATLSNYRLSYVDDENSFFPLPTCPEGNGNLLDPATTINFPFGNDGSYDPSTKTVTLSGNSSGGGGLLNNLSFDIHRPYVVSGKIKVPNPDTIARIIVAGNSSADNLSAYFWDDHMAIYGLTGYVELAVFGTGNYQREFSDELDFTVLLMDDTVSAWVNGKLIIEQETCSYEYTKANVGCSVTGIESVTSNAVISDLKAYYTQTDIEYMDSVLAALPEITLKNYREMCTYIPSLRQKVNQFENDGYKTSDLKYYDKLVAAEKKLNEMDNDLMVQDLMYVEDCISNIPKITTKNYEEQLAVSEEFTLQYATEMIDWLLEEYSDLSTNDISNYRTYEKALAAAQNNGVSPNLFDNCTGVSSVQGGSTTYDPSTNRAVVKGTSFYKFDNVAVDPERVYVLEMDVTNNKASDIKGCTRIGFKGSSAMDYVYINITGPGATMYDPVDMVEQHNLGSGNFSRTVGKPYHVKIITGPGFATVVVDGKVIINAAPIDTRYTGNFFTCYTYGNASATFDNIDLHYYDGEPINYSAKTGSDNLICSANNLRGVEFGLGFYGQVDPTTDTVDILGSGVGGWLDGVKIDYSKPVVFSANVKADADDGSVNLLLSGKDSLTGLCAGLSSNRATLFEVEYGLDSDTIQSIYFPRKKGQTYKLEVLYEQGKVSLFIDGECYYRDESGSDYVLGDFFGFFNERMSGTSSLSGLNVHYASDQELAAFQKLKESMPEHIAPEEQKKDSDDDYDDYDEEEPEEEPIEPEKTEEAKKTDESEQTEKSEITDESEKADKPEKAEDPTESDNEPTDIVNEDDNSEIDEVDIYEEFDNDFEDFADIKEEELNNGDSGKPKSKWYKLIKTTSVDWKYYTWPIIICVLVILLAVGTALWLLVKKKKQKKEQVAVSVDKPKDP